VKHKITYRSKFQLLICGSALFILFCYLTAFKKTIEEKKILTENRKLVSIVTNAEKIRQNLLTKLSKVKPEINNSVKEGINNQERLLELVNRKTSWGNIKIIELPKQENIEEGGFLNYNQTIVVQGNFKELLSFVRAIEDDKNIGKICSADFFRYTEKKSGFSVTRLKLCLQKLIPM
jgi:hypothetical protein